MKEALDLIAAILVIAAIYNIIRGGSQYVLASANEFHLTDAAVRLSSYKKLALGGSFLIASMLLLLFS